MRFWKANIRISGGMRAWEPLPQALYMRINGYTSPGCGDASGWLPSVMIRTRLADYGDATDLDRVIRILDAYACDPMGGSEALAEAVKATLRRDLPAIPGAFTVLAFDGDAAVGAAICFMGYGTFAAKPLVNVHDLSVVPEHRGKGVGAALLQGVEVRARELGCVKVTLEVRDDNPAARLYRREGFTDGDAPMRFLTKKL